MKRLLAVIIFTSSGLLAQITSNPNTQIYAETPAGTLNGVNATFTLNNSPSLAASMSLYRNGIRQKLGTDYTLSGKAITFASASVPQLGDMLVADYVTSAAATLLNANNLSDLSNVSSARSNLGLGSAATQNTSAFDSAGTAAALLKSNNTWTGAQTFSNFTLNTAVRSVTTSDSAKTSDHTLILGGTAVTENLPASPTPGQELYLVNTAAMPAIIGGNGVRIWSAGTTSSSISLASNGTAILQFDGSLWRQIE